MFKNLLIGIPVLIGPFGAALFLPIEVTARDLEPLGLPLFV